jgi:hypothetical protein
VQVIFIVWFAPHFKPVEQCEVVCTRKIQGIQNLCGQGILCFYRHPMGFAVLALTELSVYPNKQQYSRQEG